jgi:hypothetical protein
MTLIVEDGTGLAGANSYVSVSDHVAFCALYGITIDPTSAEINLRICMDYIASKDFQGKKEFDTNELDFPRLYMCIKREPITDLQSLAKIQRVQNELGLGIAQGVNPLAIKDRVIQSEAFGAFSRTYASGAATTPTNPRVDIYLQPLLRNNKASKFSFSVQSHRYTDCNNIYNNNYDNYGQDGYVTYNGVDPYFSSDDGEVL